MADLDADQLKLSGPQRDLYEALAAIDTHLRDMYFGVLMALQQEKNPDRLALVAHGARELMEKLPRYLDVPIPKDQPTLMEQVRSLEKVWQQAKNQQKEKDVAKWIEIQASLQNFLQKVDGFLANFKKERPSRTEQPALLLRKLDPSGRPLPEAIEKLHVDTWGRCRDFFELVSHHRAEPSLEEVQAQLDVLERFLLDQLRPQTFADRDILDRIIEEGESDAK